MYSLEPGDKNAGTSPSTMIFRQATQYRYHCARMHNNNLLFVIVVSPAQRDGGRDRNRTILIKQHSGYPVKKYSEYRAGSLNKTFVYLYNTISFMISLYSHLCSIGTQPGYVCSVDNNCNGAQNSSPAARSPRTRP